MRDATVTGEAWWSALWGDPSGGAARILGVRSVVPWIGALRLRWSGGGELDALTVGPPAQAGGRTGDPTPLGPVPAGVRVVSDPVVVEVPGRRGDAGAGLVTVEAVTQRRSGWMSWNCLGAEVTAGDVRRAAREIVPRGGLVLLDDGWAGCWGDWHERDGLGASIAELAAELRAGGRTLGLWLAPFLADPGSRLAAQRPEWMVGAPGADGAHLVDARPSAPQWVLDASREEVREHLETLGDRLAAVGVGALKLDFLYAGARPGERAGEESGVAALRVGVAALVRGFRERAGADASILACGAPAPCVVGLADSCRSGGDAVVNVPGIGAPPPHPRFAHGAAILRAQERNLSARSWLWGATLPCDIDAVTAGAVGDSAPVDEATLERWLLLARRSGGPLLVSDTAAGLSPSRLERLRAELAAVPPSVVPIRPADPLALPVTPMEDDDFLSQPASLPARWEDGLP